MQNLPPESQDADLTSYIRFALGRAREFYRLFFALLLAFFLGVVVYIHFATPIYTASAALTPPRDSLADSAGAQSGGLSSISRKLGIGGGGGNSDIFDDYTRILQSNRLAQVLLHREDFMALAFPKTWDPQTRHFAPRSPVIGYAADLVKSAAGLPTVRPSDADRVYQFLDTSLSVSSPHEDVSPITDVSLRFDNSGAAEKLLGIILVEADTLLRSDRRRDVAARIGYLQEQLTKVNLGDEKASLISNLVVQQNIMMMIYADQRFASYVVETPHAPEKPTWPSFASVIGLPPFLAFGCWALTILFLPRQGRLLRRFSSARND